MRRCIQHETMHSLGVKHTQSRFDRDKYITLQARNIDPQDYYNFAKVDPSDYSSFGVQYEGKSIMHYVYNVKLMQFLLQLIDIDFWRHFQSTVNQRLLPNPLWVWMQEIWVRIERYPTTMHNFWIECIRARRRPVEAEVEVQRAQTIFRFVALGPVMDSVVT